MRYKLKVTTQQSSNKQSMPKNIQMMIFSRKTQTLLTSTSIVNASLHYYDEINSVY